jgi:hypothetical protein
MDERDVGSITLQAITKDPSITIRPPDWTPRNINTSNGLWSDLEFLGALSAAMWGTKLLPKAGN